MHFQPSSDHRGSQGLRVLAVTNMYPGPHNVSEGAFVKSQVDGLERAGISVDVLHLNRTAEGPGVYAAVPARVRQAVASCTPDLVHVMYGGVMARAVIGARVGAPVVVSLCGSDLFGAPSPNIVRRWTGAWGVYASQAAARGADAVIVKSEGMRAALGRQAARGKAIVLPNGIDLDRFRPMDVAACRERVGWVRDGFHVLFGGKPAEPVKRFAVAQQAVQALILQGMPVTLHTMDRVAHEEVPYWINAADAVLLTSSHEGSPNVIKEALACGRCVVSTDVGDVRERIDGLPGCRIITPAPPTVADALREILMTGDTADAVVKRRTAVSHLSLEAVTRRLISVYRGVLAARAAGRSTAAVAAGI